MPLRSLPGWLRLSKEANSKPNLIDGNQCEILVESGMRPLCPYRGEEQSCASCPIRIAKQGVVTSENLPVFENRIRRS